MMVRALWKPPPCTADDRIVSGRGLVTTTAVSSIRRLRPSIMGAASKPDPEANEDVRPQGGKPAHLGIAFVQVSPMFHRCWGSRGSHRPVTRFLVSVNV